MHGTSNPSPGAEISKRFRGPFNFLPSLAHTAMTNSIAAKVQVYLYLCRPLAGAQSSTLTASLYSLYSIIRPPPWSHFVSYNVCSSKQALIQVLVQVQVLVQPVLYTIDFGRWTVGRLRDRTFIPVLVADYTVRPMTDSCQYK